MNRDLYWTNKIYHGSDLKELASKDKISDRQWDHLAFILNHYDDASWGVRNAICDIGRAISFKSDNELDNSMRLLTDAFNRLDNAEETFNKKSWGFKSI